MDNPSAKRILIVDDDERICRLLSRFLSREGYDVFTAANGKEMRQQWQASEHDLLILDVMMPDEDGFTLAREIRAQSEVPIIMLSGKGDTIDKVLGLELGADDYITKPFEERELLARVRSALRRSATVMPAADSSHHEAYSSDGWHFNTRSQELISTAGQAVELTTYEFLVLECLVKRSQQVISRDELLDVVANRDWNPNDRSIDVLIVKLRKKIEIDSKAPKLIKTIRGAGYKFIGKVRKE